MKRAQRTISVPQLRPIFISCALLGLVGGGIGIAHLLPWQQTLNARLQIRALTFTYTGDDANGEKLFLQQIQPLQTLDIQGTQAGELFLTGQFSCTDCDSALKAELQALNRLAIRFPDLDSRMVVTAAPDDNLVLEELVLERGTTVRNFAYFPQSDRLDFSLDNSDNSNNSTGRLQWSANDQKALAISLEGVDIDALGIAFDPDGPDNIEELRLTYTPSGNPVGSVLRSGTRVSLGFHPQPSALAPDEFGPARWIRQDISVRDVRFLTADETGFVSDEIVVSTILSGKARLGDRTLELEANQFLTVAPETPGIDRLRSLEIVRRQDNPGLQVDVSGSRVDLLEVGFYPEFPVQTIRSTWLSAIPERFVGAIFSVFVGIVGASIGLVLQASKPKPAPNRPRPRKRSRDRRDRRRR